MVNYNVIAEVDMLMDVKQSYAMILNLWSWWWSEYISLEMTSPFNKWLN